MTQVFTYNSQIIMWFTDRQWSVYIYILAAGLYMSKIAVKTQITRFLTQSEGGGGGQREGGGGVGSAYSTTSA